MKQIQKTFIILFSLALFSCGGSSDQDSTNGTNETKTSTENSEKATENKVPASERITLDDKGVGPIKSVTLAPEIDMKLAEKGKATYDAMCLGCHRPDKKFIGPAPKGVLDRRSPEWIMNMILNPEVMIVENEEARDLLIEFNGAPMANQGLTEEQARGILEYFRTLK